MIFRRNIIDFVLFSPETIHLRIFSKLYILCTTSTLILQKSSNFRTLKILSRNFKYFFNFLSMNNKRDYYSEKKTRLHKFEQYCIIYGVVIAFLLLYKKFTFPVNSYIDSSKKVKPKSDLTLTFKIFKSKPKFD
ncbi:hypothetical protein BpHYR1_008513 [Brachionus plicatilis]|uniref:Uncharacterized protein n=1 Tax=Brachionus plicatilis TaxID=10195 RepID=A0A3M7T593_BRAPC|nr:hypothetical protein BpHYR1_008513 [Brachionus plicatilis]